MLTSLEELTVKILEVGQFDAFPHTQNVSSSAQAVEHHPKIASVQGRHSISGGLSLCSRTHAGQGVLDVCPGGDDGAQNHQAKREEGHWRDGASEPQNFAVRDQDDSQVFENSVYGNGEELERPSARVNHADEKQRNGEPWKVSTWLEARMYPAHPTFLCLVTVEVAVCDDSSTFANRNCRNANNGLPECQLHPWPNISPQSHTCTASKKNGKLKSTPDRTYLFVTVIRMDEPQ